LPQDASLVPPHNLPGSCLQPQYPDYPQESEAAHETGSVQVQLRVSTEGNVIDQRVEASSGFPRLDEAALVAAAQCQFKPATRNGVAEEAWFAEKVTYLPPQAFFEADLRKSILTVVTVQKQIDTVAQYCEAADRDAAPQFHAAKQQWQSRNQDVIDRTQLAKKKIYGAMRMAAASPKTGGDRAIQLNAKIENISDDSAEKRLAEMKATASSSSAAQACSQYAAALGDGSFDIVRRHLAAYRYIESATRH
jgi:TonB family protein